ncbi:MAG: hypothetical protein WEE64_03100 [Dehalococcoidia bacterium]
MSESLGLLGVLVLWGALGLVPWCVALFAGRGRGALVAMPLAFAAGIAAGALVPALGAKDATGFAVSLGAAMAGGAVVVGGLALRDRRMKAEAPKT